jgi:hypothetical protein
MRDRDRWILRFFAMMTIACLALLIFHAVCSAQITIEGPARVDVGQEAVLVVHGTPRPDPDAPWGDAFKWLRDLSLRINAPDESKSGVRANFVLDVDLETGGVVPRLQVMTRPDRDGVYVVDATYWPDRSQSMHRLTVGRPPPPPDPDPDPDPGDPTVNPYPRPDQSLQTLVDPIRAATISRQDATRWAEMYAQAAERVPSQIQRTDHLRQFFAGSLRELGIAPTATSAAEPILRQRLGIDYRTLTQQDVDLLRAMAWAAWEAGKK